ncbi:MAG: DPP IV N-terminal domain-containing protein, partial [Streptosporangiaceae bacterium]
MTTDTESTDTESTDADERLRRFARSRRFLLGRPRDLAFASGRLLFLRALGADDPVTGLWSLDPATGEERLLADPRALLGGEPEVIPAAERRRRERMRETARGIVAYTVDTAGRRAAFALSGRLFTSDLGVDLDRDDQGRGVIREIPVAGPCVDPQLSPDGNAVAWLAGRALRVTGLDGRVLLELSDQDPQVSFGAAEFGAAEEMSRHHGCWWSPDGQRLLVAGVSEHDVASWWLSDPSDAATEPVHQRYPFAGTANPKVRLLLVGLDGSATGVDVPTDELPYLLAVRWGPAGLLLVLHTRDHGRSEIRAVDPQTGTTRLVRADTDPDWLELTPGTPRFLGDGRLLHVADSEDTHRLVIGDEPVTPPGLQVISVAGTAGETTIFCATTEPVERHVYSLDHRTGEITRLSGEPGLHSAVADGALLAISSET